MSVEVHQHPGAYEVGVQVPGRPGPPGPTGPQGPPGPEGHGLEGIKGTLVAPIDLPADAQIGDAYIVDGDLWIYK